MRKMLVLVLVLFFLSFINCSNKKEEASKNDISTAAQSIVIICIGKYSKRYHNSMCKGMEACKGERKKVSLLEAKEMGLTACGYCY